MQNQMHSEEDQMDIRQSAGEQHQGKKAEQEVDMNLRRKLQVFKMLNVSTLEETDEILKQWSLRSTQCAFPIKKDHLYFKCADCSSQPSHCICEECFLSANHTGHNFLYFNKLTGGTCDCGDPNLSQLLQCGKHQLPSKEYKELRDNIISEEHQNQIVEYFRNQFQTIFETLESIDLIPEESINMKVKMIQMSLFKKVIQEILAFIHQNPAGAFLLSKVLIDPLPNFQCHHVCNAKCSSDPFFEKISREIVAKCECSITTNLFRYLSFYTPNFEYELELLLNYFFVNNDFKVHLVKVFCEMFYFMEVNYSEDAKLYRLFYQFNNVHQYQTFAKEMLKSNYLFIAFENAINVEITNYKKYWEKMFFYYYLFYFIASNESNKEVWSQDFSFPLRAVQSICKSVKTRNLGAHFIFQRLISDYLFMLIYVEIQKILEEMDKEKRIACMQQILFTIVDESKLQKEIEIERKSKQSTLKSCVKLEQQIFEFVKENASHQTLADKLDSIQDRLFYEKSLPDLGKLDNIKTLFTALNQFYDEIKEIVRLPPVIESSTATEESTAVQQNVAEEEMKEEEEEEQEVGDDPMAQIPQFLDIGGQPDFLQLFFQQLSNQRIGINIGKKQKFLSINKSNNNQVQMKSLTDQIPVSEKKFCPLFNNSYRILSMLISRFLNMENSIQEGMDVIRNAFSSANRLDDLRECLIFGANQLGETLDYLRFHQEQIMGFNDYHAIQEGLPGNKADLVPIERNYMNSDYNLYDYDILSLQTIAVALRSLGNSKQFFDAFIEGAKVFAPDQNENLQMKRTTNLLKNIMIISLDTTALLNCSSHMSVFDQWLVPSLKSVLNIAFQNQKTYSLQTLKQKLNSLKVSKNIQVKHALLLVSKIVDDRYERIVQQKLVYEPFSLLRENQMHSDYYEILKELQKTYPEVEFILGNQLESIIQSNGFVKEILNAVCEDSRLIAIFINALDSLQITKAVRDKLQYSSVQYSLKYMYMFLLIMKDRSCDASKAQLQQLVENERIQQRLTQLKETEKEFVKSIQMIETLLAAVRKELDSTKAIDANAAHSNSNKIEEEIDQEDIDMTIFKKRAREAQQKHLDLMKQKSDGFFEANKEQIMETSKGDDALINKCIYCQDPEDKRIQCIQAFIEKDNLDSYSNKTNRIPISQTFKYIMSNCPHTAHHDCKEKARIHARYKPGVLVPPESEGIRRKIEGFCMQCRCLFNIGVPQIDKFNKPQLIYSQSQSTPHQVIFKSTPLKSKELEINQESFFFFESLVQIFDAKTEAENLHILEQTFTSSSHMIYNEGMQPYFKRLHLLNSNILLNARIIMSEILINNSLLNFQSHIKNTIESSIQRLNSIDEFKHVFLTGTSTTQVLPDYSYQDLIALYVSTCFYMLLVEKQEQKQFSEVATNVILLSEVVFKNIVQINAKLLAFRSNLIFSDVQEILDSQEFMDSLMDYVMPWSNLITSTILSLYEISGSSILQDFVLSDRRNFDFELKVYELEVKLLPFLKITPQLLQGYNEIKLPNNIDTIPIHFLEVERIQFSEVGKNYKLNHNMHLSKRCNKCVSFPRATKSDLHLCLICSKQMCSITCEEINIFEGDNQKLKELGTLNKHAIECHQGKAIFLNLQENQLLLIDSPMSITYDNLFFDSVKQPIKIEPSEIVSSKFWGEYSLDETKLNHYLNVLRTKQLPNKIRSIIQFGTLPIEIQHLYA